MIAASPTRAASSGGRRFGSVQARLRHFDLFMLSTTIVLMGFGAVAIWSASGSASVAVSNPGVRQALFGVVGLALSFVAASIDYRFFASAAWIIYGIGLALLALVLVPGIGSEVQGGRRWLDLRLFDVQPSEIVKLTTMIALAAFISSRGSAMKEFGNFVLSLLIVAIPMVLIAAEPDFDSALMFGVIWASMMILARTRTLYLVALAALAPAVAGLTYVFLLHEFHRNRIKVFLGLIEDPLGLSYQAEQAEISIGSGGWFGFGLAGGSQSRLDLLGVRTTDFVFAHASAMFGFVGMLALFACFVILLWRCLRVVELARDDFGRCFAIGVTGALCFQAFINIGMNLGLLPVAGIPLPFVSVGVSTLWTFLLAEGILQSILIRHRKLAFQPA